MVYRAHSLIPCSAPANIEQDAPSSTYSKVSRGWIKAVAALKYAVKQTFQVYFWQAIFLLASLKASLKASSKGPFASGGTSQTQHLPAMSL